MTEVLSGNSFDDFYQFYNSEKKRWSSVFILVDSNTHDDCLPIFFGEMKFDENIEILEVDPGEESKDIEIAVGLWLSLNELNADRNSLLINLGGGVICDLGAWVATNYKRGIDFINIPTTLLAMIDAAIGGKNGIDLGSVKNLIGSFSEAQVIFNYPPFLKTLPQKEWESGFSEMVKHALISSKDFWEELTLISPNDHDDIKNFVARAAAIKIEVVDLDYKESGIRKKLNYGHTIGHAIESISLRRNEALTHGHSITIGMIIANRIAHLMGLFSKDEMHITNNYLSKYYSTPLWLIEEFDALIEIAEKDKKNNGTQIKMVLLKEIGEVIIDVEVDKQMIKKAINSLSS